MVMSISSQGTVGFVENSTPVLVGNNFTINNPDAFSYGGGYVRFDLANANSADQFTLTSDANPNAVGAISFIGNVVYLGNGTGTTPIGNIDAVENGVNGQALKINFTSNFANASFESGTTGVGATVAGWTIGSQQVILGTTVIGSYTTPTDTSLPAQGINTNVPVSSSFAYEVATEGSNSPEGGGTGGSQSLRIYSGMTTAAGFDVVNGGYAESVPFNQQQAMCCILIGKQQVVGTLMTHLAIC